MGVSNLLRLDKLKRIKNEFKKAGAAGLSMRLRLFLFLILLVIILILGVIVILLLTGTFTVGLRTNEKILANRLNHTFRNVSRQYGQLSAQAVEFSNDLSKNMVTNLREKGLEVTELQNHPEVLEDLLAGEYQRALFSLQKSESSGVFIILDATVNPKLKDADTSRAGLFIKNMEPNILSSSSPTILLLRGFPEIGRKNSISLHAQWSMEFDISDAPYYRLPMERTAGQTLPLSGLYYWSPAITLPGMSEEAMLCSVPLLDSNGNVFGVCGFEISAMLFKLAHMPDNSTYTRGFCIFAPFSEDGFDTSGAMFSGGYSARNIFSNNQFLGIEENPRSFYRFIEENGNSFLGFHMPVKLYPKDSVFYDHKWAVALMVPTEDVKSSLADSNLRLSLMFTLLVVLGILISLFLSKYYLRPITKGLHMIKSNDLIETPKTKIPEIDDLIHYLSSKNEKLQKEGADSESSALVNEFIKNLKNLSPAERSVFDLYVQQYTAKEIAGILNLSINTIKTHNKRIYAKLNVSSREELLVYINILKEAGKKIE